VAIYRDRRKTERALPYRRSASTRGVSATRDGGYGYSSIYDEVATCLSDALSELLLLLLLLRSAVTFD